MRIPCLVLSSNNSDLISLEWDLGTNIKKKKTPLLRYNSYIIKFTHLNLYLVYLYSWGTYIFNAPKEF